MNVKLWGTIGHGQASSAPVNEEFAAPFISPVEPPTRAKLRSSDGRFSSELHARLRGGSTRWITFAIGTSLLLVILGVAAIVS